MSFGCRVVWSLFGVVLALGPAGRSAARGADASPFAVFADELPRPRPRPASRTPRL